MRTRKSRIRRKKRGRKGLGLVVVLTLVICLLIKYRTMQSEASLDKLNQQIGTYQEEKSQLEKEKEELKRKDNMTKAEMEELARNIFGLVYSDEIILVPDK